MEFSFAEKYRLELRWNKIRYVEDQKAVLEGCYFTGPVLNEMLILNQEDSISLDFVNQYLIFVESFYIASLSWKEVRHTPNKIFLFNVLLENRYLNVVPKLKNNDYIIIDTSKHEDEEHLYNLVYTSYLVNENGELYNFREMK
jgi:hypothetical protein